MMPIAARAAGFTVRGEKEDGGKEGQQIEEREIRCPGGNRHHRGEWTLLDERVDEHSRDARENAVWRSFGCDRAWRSGRKTRGVSGAARPRAQDLTERDQLPRERLRDEAPGRRAHYFRERGRFAEGGFASRRISRRRPVFRPHEEPHLHVFWRRNRCSRGVCASYLRPVVGHSV